MARVRKKGEEATSSLVKKSCNILKHFSCDGSKVKDFVDIFKKSGIAKIALHEIPILIKDVCVCVPFPRAISKSTSRTTSQHKLKFIESFREWMEH